ncbi:MAG TPA: cytochrome c3 family protein [Rhodocyclaceae bacterium]
MSRLASLFAAALLAGATMQALALDPPHDASRNIQCITCHMLHGSPGGTLNRVAGNANVCLSCHVPTGQAAARPFAAAGQALPPEPRPTGWTAGSGISHRWDSGPSGHVKPVSGNTSTGHIASLGSFTGRIEETYTITIATAGTVGTATFDWSSLRDGSGSAVVTAPSVGIGSKGLSLAFANGSGTPSFRSGDQWLLRARTDLRLPDQFDVFERQLWQRVMREELPDRTTLGDPKVVCSTCHDQHSQKHQPFDAAAPIFLGAGTGWISTGIGRHLQRQPNENNQMCKVCHSARNVASAAAGSHPVGVAIPGGDFQSPAGVPLSAELRVECMSCHAPHYTDSGGANAGNGDGFLLRTRINDLCFECHTNADRANGAHFNTTTGALWGGSKEANGTQFPRHQAGMRGACVNCHWPHGWPDRNAPAQDYPRLWVERYDVDRTTKTDGADGELLCFACHTAPSGGVPATPATSNIQAEFARGSALASATGDVFRHPVNDVEQQNGNNGLRVVECVDCHNPHKARANDRHAGVSGVNLAGTTLPAGSSLQQQEVCFKCHGDTFNSARPNASNKRLDFNTSAANSGYHPVTQAGRGQSANLAAQLLGGLTTASTIRCSDCHNSSAFSGAVGTIADSPAVTVGPHGSEFAPILRADFGRNYTSTGWNNANATLCFGCHDQTMLLARDRGSGARTNFYGGGRDNLHWYHLENKGVTSSCMSCHFDLHSNRTASNTQYRVVDGATQTYLGTAPPPNVKTHLVNFAPDVTGASFALPRWQINTANGVRTCDLACHGDGGKMDPVSYGPTTGDETSHTY